MLRKFYMLKLFLRYASVGVLNTALHWATFSVIYFNGKTQAVSNFSAFCIAVTFSFFVNAKWTFKSQATTVRYLLYVLFMGILAAATGWYADRASLNPIITLIVFSAISLICGFIYSKYVVFREIK